MNKGHDAAEVAACLPRVYRAILALGARADEADDATQDAAERALRTSGHIERIDAWLYVVASRRWRQRRFQDRLLRPLEWIRSDVDGVDDSNGVSRWAFVRGRQLWISRRARRAYRKGSI